MDVLAEFNDEDVNSGLMDLHDLTFSEMSLDQLPELPMSRKRKREKRECPVEKIKKTKGIGDGTSTHTIWGKTSTHSGYKKFLKKLRYKRLMTIKANSKDKNAAKKTFE